KGPRINGPSRNGQKSAVPFSKRSSPDENRGSPASPNARPRPAERKQTKGQPRHDCQNRQANQPARFTLRSQQERRAQQEKRRCPAATTACAASPAQALPRDFRGQNPKGRANPDPPAPAASAVGGLNKKRGRPATTTCPASSAQGTAASLPRGQNPKGRSVLDRTACAASFRAVLSVSAS